MSSSAYGGLGDPSLSKPHLGIRGWRTLGDSSILHISGCSGEAPQLLSPRVTSILVPTSGLTALASSETKVCNGRFRSGSPSGSSRMGPGACSSCLQAISCLSSTVLYTLSPLQSNSGPGPFADFLRTLQTQHRNDFLCNISSCPPSANRSLH